MSRREMVRVAGFEPAASSFRGKHSSRLSYTLLLCGGRNENRTRLDAHRQCAVLTRELYTQLATCKGLEPSSNRRQRFRLTRCVTGHELSRYRSTPTSSPKGTRVPLLAIAISYIATSSRMVRLPGLEPGCRCQHSFSDCRVYQFRHRRILVNWRIPADSNRLPVG